MVVNHTLSGPSLLHRPTERRIQQLVLRAVAAHDNVAEQGPQNRGVAEPDDAPTVWPKAIERVIAVGNHNGHSSGTKRCQPESRFATITVTPTTIIQIMLKGHAASVTLETMLSLPSNPVASKRPNMNASTRPTS